jgi:leucyl aminopeptidase
MVARIIQPVVTQSPEPGRGALAVGCVEGRALPLASLPPALATRLRQAARAQGWKATHERKLTLSTDDDRSVVTLYGLGEATEIDHSRLAAWLAAVAADAATGGVERLTVVPPPLPLLASTGGAAVLLRRLALLGYSFDDFRQKPGSQLRQVRVLPSARTAPLYRRAKQLAVATARGIVLARDLANTPPNRATPAWMAAQARALGRRIGAKVKVYAPKELARLEMRALLAVGQGSSSTPRLVRLDVGRRGPIVALVGKGITFDTGGISIKPGPAMDEMKYDKAGACTVLGIVQAVAELELPIRLQAYLPLAENMPDGRAYRPGDIVRTRSGKTVEVLNTDAEGRLVLADALSLALEAKPEALVEFSTLTGATVVALGHHGAALYSPDDRLAKGLLDAAEAGGERLWRMPLWPEFSEEMKGRHADLRNVAGRWGGANTAAAFLAEFTTGLASWAHLDIAGTAWIGGEQGAEFGATGYGVATTLCWLSDRFRAG